MGMRNSLLMVTLCLLSFGCATGYHQSGFSGGFRDTKLQEGTYRVEFRGNGYTGNQKSEDFVLLRCAEITLENGYRYFVIVDEKSVLRSYVVGDSQGVSTFHKPLERNVIQCFKEKPLNVTTIVYDASEVANNIRQQYGLSNHFVSAGERK